MSSNKPTFKAPVVPSGVAVGVRVNSRQSDKEEHVVKVFMHGMKAIEAATVLSKQMNAMAEQGYELAQTIQVNASESVIVYRLK